MFNTERQWQGVLILKVMKNKNFRALSDINELFRKSVAWSQPLLLWVTIYFIAGFGKVENPLHR